MASQQNPPRTLFRLASLARPPLVPAPAPAPAPTFGPAPTFVRPAFPQTLRPAGPQPQPTQPQESAPTSLPVTPTRASAPPPSTPPLRTATPTTESPTEPQRFAVPAPRPQTQPFAPVSSSVPTSPSLKSSLPPSPTLQAVSQNTTDVHIRLSASVPPSPQPKLPTSSLQSSPVRKPAAPSPAPPPPSPLPSTVTRSPISAFTAGRVFTRAISDSPEKSPPQSPKTRPISRPPTPLTLPPALIRHENDRELNIPSEPEQKTVLLQEKFDKHKLMPKTSNDDHQQRYVGDTQTSFKNAKDESYDSNKDKGIQKKLSSPENMGMKIITIAGENKGAIMELSPSSGKKVFKCKPQSLLKNEKSSSSSSSDNEQEESSKRKDKNQKASANKSLPVTAFMNSNVQGVNNSILYNVNCSHNDPGVHFRLTRKVANGGRGIILEEKR